MIHLDYGETLISQTKHLGPKKPKTKLKTFQNNQLTTSFPTHRSDLHLERTSMTNSLNKTTSLKTRLDLKLALAPRVNLWRVRKRRGPPRIRREILHA